MAKQIHQYALNGNYIRSFKSINDAARVENRNESSIRRAAESEGVSAGLMWSYHQRASIYDTDTIDKFITSHNIPPEEVIKTRIHQTSKGEELISIETRRIPVLDPEQFNTLKFISTAKSLQHKTDELRVIKKEFRESSRVENTLTVLNEALVEILSTQSFKPITYKHPDVEGPILIVQLTDLHFNELVNLPDNSYSFEIGAKRMQKYADKIRRLADLYKAKGIVVALTGDLISSDRRLDQMMTQATNRMKASIIATQIIYHFLQDINHSCNLSVLSVSGNESRVKEEFGMSGYVMTDNYDFLIFNMLKLLFKDNEGITFIDGDPVEQVININNSNVLITHGTTIKEGQGYMQQVFGKYAAKGILLDYAIFGHVHFTNITDIYSRSGSLVGNSVYSDRYLNLVTKASQVIHVFDKDGSIDNIKISLQYCDKYEGYHIKDDPTAHNSTMSEDNREKQIIVQVVI